VLEHTFLMMYYMGFTYVECYNLPIWQRVWFIQRLNTEIERMNKANKGQGAATRAAHDNTPDARELMGRHRSHVPAKLRRFT
jgi:hypothetical protein